MSFIKNYLYFQYAVSSHLNSTLYFILLELQSLQNLVFKWKMFF